MSATLVFATFVGCGGDDEGADGSEENGGSAGASATSGSSTGGSSGSSASGSSGTSAGRGGSASGGSSGASGRGGSSSGSGGAGATSGKGGSAGRGGSSGSSSAGAGSMDASGGEDASGGTAGKGGSPPSGGGNGGSPYEIECHGDTLECGDIESLLCLGIRVGEEVFGYSCANECETNADCSDEAASAEAAAECVDFVSTGYCLLVCKNGDDMKSCPGGMYCYNYPGSPTGYCLWE